MCHPLFYLVIFDVADVDHYWYDTDGNEISSGEMQYFRASFRLTHKPKNGS